MVVNKYVGDDPGPEVIEKLNRLIASGPFEVYLARTFPLEQAAEAHRALEWVSHRADDYPSPPDRRPLR